MNMHYQFLSIYVLVLKEYSYDVPPQGLFTILKGLDIDFQSSFHLVHHQLNISIFCMYLV